MIFRHHLPSEVATSCPSKLEETTAKKRGAGGRIGAEEGCHSPFMGGRKLWREEWMRDRARLRNLLTQHPDWRQQDYAQAVGRSISWVKKWRKRLREADP